MIKYDCHVAKDDLVAKNSHKKALVHFKPFSVQKHIRITSPELQKHADRADQSVFWEKHAKNCAIMSMAHITYAIWPIAH